MANYRLHIKIGPHEFDAEGPQAAVEAQFEAFKALLSTGDVASAPTPPNGVEEAPVASPDLDDAKIQRIFDLDEKSGLVTLNVLPQGTGRKGDTILLLLLGYESLKDETEVAVTDITQALRQSGRPVTRVDRAIAEHLRGGRVLKGGRAKGSRYQLTNTGREAAKGMVAEMGL